MQKLFTPRLLLFLLPLAVIGVVLYSLLARPPAPAPTVLSTNPPQDSRAASIYDPITIELDQDINPALLSVSSSPAEDWQVVRKDNLAYSLTHAKYLRVETLYTLDLYYNQQPLYTLSFTTFKQQSDPRYMQEVQAEMTRDYPLSSVFPYDHPHYYALYTAPRAIEIRLKSTQITENEALQQVKNIFGQKGVDPATHSFKTLAASPPPAGGPTPAPGPVDEFGDPIIPPPGPVDPLYY